MIAKPLSSMILVITLSFLSLGQTWLIRVESQEPSLTMQTNKESYSFGDEVVVQGNIGKFSSGKTLSLELSSNSGKYSTTANDIFVSTDGSYTYAFKLEGLDGGTYTVTAKYGDEQARAVFEYSGPTFTKYATFTLSSRLDGNEYIISGRNTEGISPKGFTIYSGKSIAVELEAKSSGIVELSLPKEMIERVDSVEVTALDYSTQSNFQKISNNDNSTIIRLAVPKDATSISLTGLHVVPEFPVAQLIAALSLAGVIAVSVKWKKLL